jgi:hypothetical protein
MSYGDGSVLTMGYDNRMRVASFSMPGIFLDKAYQYEADGRLRFAEDLADSQFDRSYSYDHAGRLAEAHTDAQARGEQASGGPYQQTYAYDAFDHSTGRTTALWSENYGDTGQYVNDRRTNWGYDAAGNLTNDQMRQYVFDAAGRMKSFNSGLQSYSYDGEGGVARVTRQIEGVTLYNLRSSVLGGAVVSQLKPQSNAPDVRQDIIYADGEVLARHDVGVTTEQVSWDHTDAASTKVQETGMGTLGAFSSASVQLDPVGASMGNADPAQFEEPPPPPDETNPEYPVYGNPRHPGGMGCASNLVPVLCPDLLRDIAWRGGGMRSYRVDASSPVFRVYGTLTAHYPAGASTDEVEGVGTYSTTVYGRWEMGTSVSFAGYVGGGVGFLQVASPQKRDTFDDAYKNCLGKLSNNEDAPAPGLLQTGTIMTIAFLTGVDTTLLAATWRYEGGFDSNGFLWTPTNGLHREGNPIGDIGPGQIYPGIWEKSPFTNGLTNPLGTNRKVEEGFNGNPYENLVLTARALLDAKGSREHQAGMFRAGRQFDTVGKGKKKKKVENSTYRRRVNAFNKVAPNYDSFFDCLRSKGFF